jgi:transcription antitermination protein NusB
MAGRRNARRAALFLLYQQDLMSISPEAALSRAERSGEQLEAYSRHLLLGVGERRESLDEVLSRNLQGWTLDRLAPLERNILRLGLFEMRYVDEVPAEVAINESVELAKKFASVEAASLVNGVLGAAAAEED